MAHFVVGLLSLFGSLMIVNVSCSKLQLHSGGHQTGTTTTTSSTCQLVQTGCTYTVTMQSCNQQQQRSLNSNDLTSQNSTKNDAVIARINAAQSKLERMIKDLSVRTLRHIRQIKTTLSKVHTIRSNVSYVIVIFVS